MNYSVTQLPRYQSNTGKYNDWGKLNSASLGYPLPVKVLVQNYKIIYK